ncbi:MAG: proton-conducting transporter membrane subunit, partial [Candidatus Zixiibacteriota bacterium]
SVGFYVFAYLFVNMGAFGAVAIFEDKSGSCQIASYRGLAKTSPLLAHSLAVFLLSLAGIPPLAGFLAKYYIFASAIKVAGSDTGYSWLYWLVGIGLATAVFALYYYANVIKQMYFSADPSPYRIKYTAPALSVIVISLVGVILFGLAPEPVLRFAGQMSEVFALIPR